MEDNFELKVIGGLILGIILFILALSPIRWNTEQGGTHNGYITAVDQEGIFYPNYHIFVKTDNQSSQEDSYCVPQYNRVLADQLKAYSRSKTRVNIEYVGIRGYGWHLCIDEQITRVTPE